MVSNLLTFKMAVDLMASLLMTDLVFAFLRMISLLSCFRLQMFLT